MGSGISQSNIIVLGSSGSVGTATVQALAARGIRATAGVRNPDPKAPKNAGLVKAGAKLVAADMSKPSTLSAILSAGSRVLIVTPGHEDRTQHALNAIQAAKAAGAAHIGLISVTSVGSTGLFADQFRSAENAAAASGLPFTILRLPMFMDNFLGQPLKDAGAIFQPVAANVPFSSISVADVGEAVANAMAFPTRYANRTLNVAGATTTGTAVAQAFSAALGKPVNYTEVPAAVTRDAIIGMGMPVWQADGLMELLALRAAGDRTQAVPDGDNHTTELLGRAPTSVQAFARAFRGLFLSEPADPSTVVVLGASGSVGSATVTALAAAAATTDGPRVEVVAGVRNPDQNASKNSKLVSAGAKLVAADMGKPTALAESIPAGSTVLIVTPGAENRRELACNAIAAAKKAGASHVGLISVTSVEAGAGLFAAQFRPIEGALVASGLPFTVFRLPMFLDNVLGQPIKTASAIYQPQPADAHYNVAAVADIGAAVATALVHPERFVNRTVNVAGIRVSGTELAHAFSHALGKEVTYTQVPGAAAREAMEGMGMPAWQAGGVLELMELQAAGDKTHVVPDGDNHTRELLGREPIQLAQWVDGVKGFFK